MSILLSLQAVGAQTAEQMDYGCLIAIVADGMLYIYPAPDGHPPRR